MRSDKINNWLNIIDKSLENAEQYKSLLNPELTRIKGFSGTKTRHFLNNLVQGIGGRYLEIGVWAGSTFCSALNGSKVNEYSVACRNNLLFMAHLPSKILRLRTLEIKSEMQIYSHAPFD